MSDLTITPQDNGPLKVEGGVRILDAAGNLVESNEPVFLCRCGHSANKPFCDSTHKKINFTNEVRAK